MADGLIELVARELRQPGGAALAEALGVEAALEDGPQEDDTPIAAVPWPDPPVPEAFYGLAGDIVRTIEPHTEADPVALLVQFLVAFGNAVGRGPHFVAEADRHGLNLFACLVGATAKG
ncbi:MAG: hypothetical protein AB1700_18055, partial [Bacillota bacterium]